MNGDKFDRIVLDLLYGELDELTAAAARRHMDQSSRARELFAHLRATRELSALPTHSPPAGFAEGLIERERRVRRRPPLHQRLGRLVSILAGYAMRPQLVMGALLLLMLGSSLMLLRAQPGPRGEVQVTERGAPEAEPEPPPRAPEGSAPAAHRAAPPGPPPEAAMPAVAPARPARAAPQAPGAESAVRAAENDALEEALRLQRRGRHREAQRRFERISRGGGGRAAEAALLAAQATSAANGCASAIASFERVRVRFPGSAPAHEATWRAASCRERVGDAVGAREAYAALLGVPSHAERARAALAKLSARAQAADLGGAPPRRLSRP